MKNPPLDQTEGQREDDQARKLSQPMNQLIRRAGQQVLLKRHKMDNVSDPSSSPNPDREGTSQDVSNYLPTRDYSIGHKLPSHNILFDKALPLIPNARGSLVIPFDHFINNDLEYLKGGSLSHKYTTSITKTKAADYGQIKWIEDRIPRSMWSTIPVVYDKHAYWGTYHWGPKRQRFYGYATNMENSKDVYSKHRIITVISLKIMMFYGYRKLTNLSLDEGYALNVALRMYTRRIVIQERVEDLQLAVESYQKKINLARPDSQQYLPKRRWSNQDKRRARVMINAIDRKLRDRRLMRSLEKFVGGRPYGEDLRLDPHRFEGTNKDGNGGTWIQLTHKIHSHMLIPDRQIDEVLKLKNFEKDASLQLSSYQIKKGMSMSVPKSQVSQDGKDYKMAKRDYAWLMIS
ncbi:hypothetical protein Tco_0765638 [Tanacetum coccineum]